MDRPNGKSGIIEVFGNPYEWIRPDGSIDPTWELRNMSAIPISVSMPLSWDKTKIVSSIYGHKLMAPIFKKVFQDVVTYGVAKHIKTYGGCYNYRPKRGQSNLSTHTWGIAIDLNPETNGLGVSPDLNLDLVKVFEDNGFIWGGRWVGRNVDGMHFQYCSGY